jgi:hypothetical protein
MDFLERLGKRDPTAGRSDSPIARRTLEVTARVREIDLEINKIKAVSKGDNK